MNGRWLTTRSHILRSLRSVVIACAAFVLLTPLHPGLT